MALAVEAEQLVKRYTGRGETVDAVRGVDLRVAEGEVFGFLGESGDTTGETPQCAAPVCAD